MDDSNIMAQALAYELYLLVEKLTIEKSPLIERVLPLWKTQYFEDLVATWKRMDHMTSEMAELKKAIQQLSALMLPPPCYTGPEPPVNMTQTFQDPPCTLEELLQHLEPSKNCTKTETPAQKRPKKTPQRKKSVKTSPPMAM